MWVNQFNQIQPIESWHEPNRFQILRVYFDAQENKKKKYFIEYNILFFKEKSIFHIWQPKKNKKNNIFSFKKLNIFS